MSIKYPYISLSVAVASNPDTPTVTYSYNDAPTVELPAMRQVAQHFMSLNEGYLIWTAGTKRAFTFFLMDAEATYVQMAVTMMIDRDVLMAGRPIVGLLGAIKSRVRQGEALTDETIQRLIGQAGMPEQPLRSECEAWREITGDSVCCRTYTSGTELTNILGFPRQAAYDAYRGVVVVSASVLMADGAELPQITEPVDTALMVVCPDGVQASEQRVSFNDHLKVTYTSEGFDPVSVMFEVGTTNRYVRINGPALVVNTAHHAGIIFRRRVPFTVESSTGGQIETYTMLINGRTANRTEEGFEVSNLDFQEGGEAKITVSSTNFSSYSRTFTPQTLEEDSPLIIVLEPEAKDLVLRLDFGGGRVVQETLNIEKNTPEYCQLRAGNFHGFRAHRLMGSSPETYNIDVRPTTVAATQAGTNESVAVAAESVETESTHQGPTAPVIEKAESAIHKEERTERKAPEFVNETLDFDSGEPTPSKPITEPRHIDYKKVGFVALVVILAICAFWLIFRTSGSGEEGNGADSLAADSVAAATAGQASAAVAAVTPEEQADIDYLNKAGTWKRAEVKTPKYQALFTALDEGDIDAFVGNDYFAVKDRCTNKKAEAIADYVWKAKGSPSEKANQKLMRAMKDKESIDLHSFGDDLAKKRPAEKVNDTPRPTK